MRGAGPGCKRFRGRGRLAATLESKAAGSKSACFSGSVLESEDEAQQDDVVHRIQEILQQLKDVCHHVHHPVENS